MSESEKSHTGSTETIVTSKIVDSLLTRPENNSTAVTRGPSGLIQTTQTFGSLQEISIGDKPVPISDREYRAQERSVIKHVQVLERGCRDRQTDREALTAEEVHRLLAQAVEQLDALKELQIAKMHHAVDLDEKRDWICSIELTDTRTNDIKQKYEDHIQYTVDRPPTDRDRLSRRSSRSGRRSSASSRYSTTSISTSVRAKMDMDAVRIDLEKKRKEIQLRTKLTDMEAARRTRLTDMEAARRTQLTEMEAEHNKNKRQQELVDIELDRERQICELQLEINESAARYERARMEVRYLDENFEPPPPDVAPVMEMNGPAEQREPAVIHGPADAGVKTKHAETDVEMHADNARTEPGSNQGPAIGHNGAAELSSSPHGGVEQQIYSLEKNSPLNVQAPQYIMPSGSLGHEISTPFGQTERNSPYVHHDFDYTPTRNSGYGRQTQQRCDKTPEVVDKLLLKQLSEKKTEGTKFSGKPLHYLSFRNEFNLLIQKFPNDPVYLFSALENFLSGNAREDIQHCKDLLENPPVALDTALTVLKRNYGSDHKVRRAHLDYLCDQDKPVGEDADSIRKLLSDLERSKILLRMNEHRLYLDSPDTIKAIMQRLPENIRTSFVGATNKLRNPANPGFQFLLDFISQECQYACNPFAELLTSRKSTAKMKDINKGNKKTRYVNTVTANKEGDFTSTSVTSNKPAPTDSRPDFPKRNDPICPLCKSDAKHRLQDCQTFKSKSVDERWESLDQGTRVCYSCLHVGHKSSACKSKYSCRGCRSRKHHTMLCRQEVELDNSHNNLNRESKPARAYAVNVVKENTQQAYTRVLPVDAFGKDGRRCTVYALLDSGADITIATQSLADKLQLPAEETTLSLEGIHGVKDVLAKHISFSIKGTDESSDNTYLLRSVACLPSLPTHSTSIPTEKSTLGHAHLKDLRFPNLLPAHIDLIIGTDNEKLHEVFESRYAETSRLCAHRTCLGWLLAGVDEIDYQSEQDSDFDGYSNYRSCSRCISREFETCNCQRTLETVQLMMEGFERSDRDEEKDLSLEDEMVLQLFNREHKMVDGHNELPLPFREANKSLPDNYKLASSRLASLKKQLLVNPDLLKFFTDKFNDYLNKGYLELVDDNLTVTNPDRVYYLPYFCTSQAKPRIVYDGSAQFRGSSLNKALMSGPDLMQPLIDVLLRFRQDRVAFVCDVKEMFLQVKLAPAHQDSVRILWYPNGKLDSPAVKYKFKVHPFGLNSSPAAAIYSLRQCATENVAGVSRETLNAVLGQFYMDDGLISEKSEKDALNRMEELKTLLSGYGFELAKVLSNSEVVHNNLESRELVPELHDLQMKENGIPQHKTLGIVWSPVSDDLVIKVDIKDKPRTKRGLLSMISQLFDPLGICQPYILQARHIMQDTFTPELDGWYDELPSVLQERCDKWLKDVSNLNKLKIPRCYHIDGERPTRYQLHTFSDASTAGLGAVTFLRFWKDSQWSCAFVRGKGRLISKNNTCSVARLELEAAVMGAQMHSDVMGALNLQIEKEGSLLWTDTTSVLSWIQNPSRRTKVFVANRRRQIHRLTDHKSWRYVNTTQNPADMATRDISPKKADPDSPWLKGPQFLTIGEESWDMPMPQQPENVDLEWATNTANTVVTDVKPVERPTESSLLFLLLWKYSDIYELKRRFSWLKRFRKWIMNKKRTTVETTGPLTLQELDEALLDIIQLAQKEFYSTKVMNQIADCGLDVAIKKCNDQYVGSHLKSLQKLTPFIDSHGIMRVGGRLQNSDLPEITKHQYILPKRHHITKLLVEESHGYNAHFGGAQQTLADMQKKYWIAPCDVNYYLRRCLDCEVLRKKAGKQMMAPLPVDRVTHGKKPFEATGVDYFGPVMVRINRSSHKRWIALFTCLSTRGVHLEVVHSLSSSSFLQALFRFNNAHGNPLKKLVSDNATTFHGADEELKQAFTRMQTERNIRQLQRRCIEWQFNSPLASHQGGVWERLIRSVRKILSGLPAFQRTTPNDENLLTVLKEAEAIINARPLTHIRGEADEFSALTPAMILTGCLSDSTPVDVFHNKDQFKKDWRYTQIAADQFWGRFVREYLNCLQPKAKWLTDGWNLSTGDMVLINDQNMVRGDFPKAIVTEIFPGKDGRVRNVEVRMADGRRFTRDIRKIIPLELVNDDKEEI